MPEPPISDTLFVLTGNIYGAVASKEHAVIKGSYVVGFVITPKLTSKELVEGAWSYAVQHTPKELNVADYEDAKVLLQKRHPSWQVYAGNSIARVIRHNPAWVNNDKPEIDTQQE